MADPMSAIILVVQGAVLAGTPWFAKLWVDHWLARRQQDYASRLELANATAVERLRTDLAIAAHETQARTSSLVQKQADVLSETYRLLMEAERRCGGMMAPMRLSGSPTPAERAPETEKAVNDFAIYFDRNRIYFPEADADRLEELVKHFSGALTSFGMFGIEGTRDDGMQFERYEQQKKAWTTITELVPPARRGLEARFRELLGVSKPAPPKPKSED